MTKIVEATCQCCGAVIHIEYEESPIFSIEKLAKLATCEACMEQIKRKTKATQTVNEPPQAKLPYKD